ncbi:MAG: hypothetical protein LBU23_12835 [Planctomycetota bacterium]|jgi:hypothetical protein|nr:hypothetical protein [Planctomycetota bacterium]
MSRKAAVLVLILALAAPEAGAAMANLFRRRSASDGMFPATGDVPDLTLTSRKILAYSGEKFAELYGAAGNRYLEYGLINMMVAEYVHGGKGRRLSLELATMESPVAAAGLFHHHRGKVLAGNGTPVDVGIEGVLDKGRDNRNLYFYRGRIFAKVIYSGPEPIPDLLPTGRFVDARLPAGTDAKPEGFAYIDVPGINRETIALTPGFTFNISFLPPSVWASAPGGGSVASDLFVITRNTRKEAEGLYNDYFSYLKLYADYFEEYRRGDRRFVKAVDPNQGRVLFTWHGNAMIIAARPDGYEKGEVLIDAVEAKIDEINPPKRGRR